MTKGGRPAMRGHVLKTLLLVWCSTSSGVLGYSRGAPDTTCSSMTPGHGLSRQTSASPYTITPSAGTVLAGSRMLVTLQTPGDNPGFKGFLVQARNADNQEIVGTFFTTDYSYLTCGKGFNNAVTHSSSSEKPKVHLEWEAPSNFEGDVVFTGSFVQTYDTYWIGVTSEKVTVTSPPTSPATTSTTTTITTTTTLTTTESSASVSSSVNTIPPGNAGDVVINIIDAPPAVDDVVENAIGVVNDEDEGSAPTPTFVPSPSSPTSPSLSFDTGSSNSSLSEGITGSSIGSNSTAEDSENVVAVTQRGPSDRSTPRRRFGLFGKFKTTTVATTRVTTPTTVAPVSSETSAPRIPIGSAPGMSSLQNAMQNIYLGCQSNKGCFGFPAGCETSENCDMLMTYTKVSSGYQFEITGSIGSTGYVAGGLSSDEKMGSDSVMACTSLEGEVDVLMAFNVANSKNSEILTNSKDGLSEIKTTQVDGRVYCSFIRQTVTEIKNVVFDLSEDRFHLMLARGPAAANTLRYHDNRMVSSGTSSLDEFETLEATSELFVTLHACFMIGAWVCAASCGILLARYYKQTWLKNKCCGIDQWFHLHRFFMVLTWSLTIAGFVLIVWYKQGWTDLPPSVNPHPILGVISTGLCFIQPFMALCRCGPAHKNRPIFNWLHWFVGNSAQILGLTAIFYGLDLVDAPSWTWFILIVFIAFHCVVHLILSIGQCVSDSKADRTNNVFPMKEMNGSRNPLHPVDKRMDAPGGTFRKTMLALYLIVTWVITAVLIIIVVFGEQQLRDWGILFWEK